MLQEVEYKIDNLSKPLFDLDFTEPGSWVGVTDHSDSRQSLIFEFDRMPLPEKLRFPRVRRIDEEMTLVVNSRTRANHKNGWIIDSAGNVKFNFFAGDAIQDIVVTRDFIVITYFDESFGSSGVEGQRLAVFDLEGNYLYGYMDTLGSVLVFDCYAASLVKDNQIIFFSYTDFPLVLFDVEAKTDRVWPTPVEVAGSNAVTKLGNKIYFHSPYKDKGGIYEWQIESATAKKIGNYSNHLRGLSKGRFIAQRDYGYAVISLQ